MLSYQQEKIAKLLYIDPPHELLAEVQKIALLMLPDFDFKAVQTVFDDILKVFAGNYPGYRKCNTLYHDLNHTTNCLLVMARLMHGAFVSGVAFSQRDVELGLVSALMHDTGYIQTMTDTTGTGAKYTLIHIDRSIEFMEKYFLGHGYSWEDFASCCNFLRCTGLEVKIDRIKFPSWEQEIIGKILGTADLIGQMSDANYLQKLPILYHEFKEGGVPGFADEFDLLKKTPNFWELVKKRLANELGQVDRYQRLHFWVYIKVNQYLYREAIERNMARLQLILENHRADYTKFFPPAFATLPRVSWEMQN